MSTLMWQVTRTRTNWATEPPAVPGSEPPLFSWHCRSDRAGARQLSARVRVFDGDRRLWDSGELAGGQITVGYAGPPLVSRSRYRWSVTATDDQDHQAEQEGRFGVAIDDDDWQADWICADRSGADSTRSTEDTAPAPIMRRAFSLDQQPVRATLFVAGLGIHRCTVNGRRVTDAELESGLTDFDQTVQFSTYDVTDLVDTSASVLGVELGRGFYSMTTPNVWRWHIAPWRSDRKVLVRLELYYPDGRTEAIVSDASWRWTDGPTLVDSMYEGETFDAAVATGWDQPGFDDHDWRPVRRTDPPRGRLTAQTQEPVQVVDTVQPGTWRQVGEQSHVTDLGTTIAGWAKINTGSLPARTKITITYAETLTADGTVRPENPHLQSDRFQADEIITGGQPVEWQSRFSYKGFRYLQVDGVDDPGKLGLVAQHAHSSVESAGSFTCSDPVLSWIDSAMRLTVRNNLHHVPTDTPVYEKNGWTGDAQVATEVMLGTFDLRLLLGKWLDDISDSQELDTTPRGTEQDAVGIAGRLPVVVPTPGWGYSELAPAPEWTTLYPFLLDRLVRWYDDPALASRHLPAVLRYLDYEIGRIGDDGLTYGVLGDYLAPGFDGPPGDDLRIAAGCYLYRALLLTAERVAAADADRLRTAADRISDGINSMFLADGRYLSDRENGYRQASNVLPLAMGVTPADQVGAVVAGLVADLHAHDDHHNTGCLGVSQLFRVLTRYGHPELALRVATQTTPPSWGAWMLDGDTTMREMWNEESRSRNHYFMGTVAQWLYESVAGVTMLEPGWTAFEVNPVARTGLDHASYTYESVRGTVGASWRQGEDGFTLDVTVPVGARARIRLPGIEPYWVDSGHWSFNQPPTSG